MRRPTVTGWAALVPTMLLAITATVKAQAPARSGAADPDRAVAGGGALPAGWSARADEGTIANAKVSAGEHGLHVTLGPAVILYRQGTNGSGPFHTLATFTQLKAPSHPEGYGLFFGGQALDGAAEQYTYFLVRGDGSFLVKRRDGTKTAEVTSGWVSHSAVHKADAKGVAVNLLEIDAKSDPSKIVYRVNHQPVYSMDASVANLAGVVGLRINHNLDVQVEGFDVHR